MKLFNHHKKINIHDQKLGFRKLSEEDKLKTSGGALVSITTMFLGINALLGLASVINGIVKESYLSNNNSDLNLKNNWKYRSKNAFLLYKSAEYKNINTILG